MKGREEHKEDFFPISPSSKNEMKYRWMEAPRREWRGNEKLETRNEHIVVKAGVPVSKKGDETTDGSGGRIEIIGKGAE